MKISYLLRKAAMEYLWDGVTPTIPSQYLFKRAICVAINQANDGLYHQKASEFCEVLFGTGQACWWPDFSPESQAQRFMALLFAAECAKSEGL